MIRIRGYQNNMPVGPGRAWIVDAMSTGDVTHVNTGWIEVLRPGSCEVLAAEYVSSNPLIYVWVRPGRAIAIGDIQPEEDPFVLRDYPETSDCAVTV